ncbi:MAG: DUF86 domain-containing protein [Sedimentisphaerales bacterium]|nr:DUF86 domain-containing protein [Sedimentisphaerales bacterium]
MPRDPKVFLEDIRLASENILAFTRNKTRDDYCRDALLRSAVERQFEIIGEAMKLLLQSNAAIAEQIPEYRRIIAFRNILIHGYFAIDNHVVWDVITGQLPILHKHVAVLLQSL